MKKILLILLMIYGHNAWCEGLRIKAERVEAGTTTTAWGSACFIAKHKLITAWHVVEEGGEIFVCIKGNWIACKCTRHDKEKDIALLETDAAGEVLDLLNLPDLTISGSKRATPIEDRKTATGLFLLKGDFDIGDSGAPILCEGRLIGMATQLWRVKGAEKYDMQCLPSSAIAEFLK